MIQSMMLKNRKPSFVNTYLQVSNSQAAMTQLLATSFRLGANWYGEQLMEAMVRRNITKVPPCNAIDAEYKGYCGIGHMIPSFSELKSSCIIM